MRGWIFIIGCAVVQFSWMPHAEACGVPITAEEIQHGRMPTADNLPCQSGTSAPQVQPKSAPQPSDDDFLEDFHREVDRIHREEERNAARERQRAQQAERAQNRHDAATANAEAKKCFQDRDNYCARMAYARAAEKLRKAGDREGAKTAERQAAGAACNQFVQKLHTDVLMGNARNFKTAADVRLAEQEGGSLNGNSNLSTACSQAGLPTMVKFAQDTIAKERAKPAQAMVSGAAVTADDKRAATAKFAGDTAAESCSTITDSKHPSSGTCSRAKNTLQAARAMDKSNDRAVVAERFIRAAELFAAAHDFAQQVEVLVEAGFPIPAATKTATTPTSRPDPQSGGTSSSGRPIPRNASNDGDGDMLPPPPHLAPGKPGFCDVEDPRITVRMKEISQQRSKWTKVMAVARFANKVGKMGACAVKLRALKLPLPISLPPDTSIQTAYDAVSCLELEKWQLQQACKCQDQGMKFSGDDAAEARTVEAYNQVKMLEKKAISSGIPNKAIRSYVQHADEIKNCFDAGTAAVLRNTERSLDVLVNNGRMQ